MSTNSQAEQLRALLEPNRADLVAKAVQLALAGDPQCLKLCLERLAPTPRQEAEKVVVPGLADALTLKDKATAILAAVASGAISAEAGDKLMRLLDTYRGAAIADDHEKRLAAIEQGKSTAALPPPRPPATLANFEDLV